MSELCRCEVLVDAANPKARRRLALTSLHVGFLSLVICLVTLSRGRAAYCGEQNSGNEAVGLSTSLQDSRVGSLDVSGRVSETGQDALFWTPSMANGESLLLALVGEAAVEWSGLVSPMEVMDVRFLYGARGGPVVVGIAAPVLRVAGEGDSFVFSCDKVRGFAIHGCLDGYSSLPSLSQVS